MSDSNSLRNVWSPSKILHRSLLVTLICLCIIYRLFSREVDKSSRLNQLLGVGIGIFQGLSNVALNGMFFLLALVLMGNSHVNLLMVIQSNGDSPKVMVKERHVCQ